MHALWLLAAVLTGLVTAFQPGINASLARRLEHPLHASLVNFAVGLVWLAVVAAATGPGLPRPAQLAGTSWWHWLGGACGALFVTMALVVAPRIGFALFFALLIAGQMATSLAIDHHGWLGAERQATGAGQVVGAALVAAGAYLIARR